MQPRKTHSRQHNRPTVIRDISRGGAPVHPAGLSARMRSRHDARQPHPPLSARPPPHCARHTAQQPPRQHDDRLLIATLVLPLTARTQHLSTRAQRFAARIETSEPRLGMRSRQSQCVTVTAAQRSVSLCRRRSGTAFRFLNLSRAAAYRSDRRDESNSARVVAGGSDASRRADRQFIANSQLGTAVPGRHVCR